jgi:hypothetical protein
MVIGTRDRNQDPAVIWPTTWTLNVDLRKETWVRTVVIVNRKGASKLCWSVFLHWQLLALNVHESLNLGSSLCPCLIYIQWPLGHYWNGRENPLHRNDRENLGFLIKRSPLSILATSLNDSSFKLFQTNACPTLMWSYRTQHPLLDWPRQRFVFTEMGRLVPARYSSLTVKVMVDTSLFRHRGLTSYLFARSKYMKTLIVSLNYVILVFGISINITFKLI